MPVVLSRLLQLGFLCFFVTTVSPVAAYTVAKHPKLQAFIQEMVKTHGFERAELNAIYGQVQKIPDVVAAMKRPAERLPWYRYRQLFISEQSAIKGAEFWKIWSVALKRAEKEYGVPAEFIVAIIGVESRFGRVKGKHRIIDSLTTLMLDYPRRSDFFRSEMKELLLLAREEGMDVLKMKGSYAGAMGIPQFIASSYRRYAVDFDGDGKRDLVNNTEDAIGSIANYFSAHKWKEGEPVVSELKLTKNARPESLVGKRFKVALTEAESRSSGVSLAESTHTKSLFGLVELEQKDRKTYRAGFHNFYVITRYNHSTLYAMAVFDLSQEISSKYRNGQSS